MIEILENKNNETDKNLKSITLKNSNEKIAEIKIANTFLVV